VWWATRHAGIFGWNPEKAAWAGSDLRRWISIAWGWIELLGSGSSAQAATKEARIGFARATLGARVQPHNSYPPSLFSNSLNYCKVCITSVLKYTTPFTFSVRLTICLLYKCFSN
jgi:hypothetical protein